jgi:hypothetical protein
MAESKIIWSDTAIKRLYGFLEFFDKKTGNREYSDHLYDILRKELKILKKSPVSGLRTSDDTILGFRCGEMIFFFEVSGETINILAVNTSSGNQAGIQTG